MPHPAGICIFYKFIIGATRKGYNYPIKIKIALAKIFSWFGIFIISQSLNNIKRFGRKIRAVMPWRAVLLAKIAKILNKTRAPKENFRVA